ncbi:MAG: type II secretion system F family protein [Rhodospirillum sp.]|nr:type II secretion system F family protein [Rhodospirillum sp.]MCF8489848.1 type II secretion system F family protein [Rhodospirillum sp.]MCF8499411.1 type II secretion system F family protein [Rhodospirillum sp.]
MPLFAYRAANNQGRIIRGQAEASGERDLHRRLKAAGLHLLRASPARVGARRLLSGSVAGRPKLREQRHLFLHLERALGAGVPLLAVLEDLRAVTQDPALRDLTRTAHGAVAGGRPLSEALGEGTGGRGRPLLGPLVGPVLRAGETGGDLAGACGHLSRHLAWREDLSLRLRKATRYPVLVLVVIVGLFFFLMGVVVPELTTFLTSLGERPPLQTRALIALSEGISAFGWTIPLVLAAGAGLLPLARRVSPPIARSLDALLLALPILGPIQRRLALTRFTHFFALLFRAGVPLTQCLEVGRDVLGNRVLAEALGISARAVAAGHPLSEALAMSGQFPPLVTRMARVGEDGGDLAGALEQVGAFHDQDLTEAADRLSTLLEPALLMVAGGLMGWIVWAVLVPVYDGVVLLAE